MGVIERIEHEVKRLNADIVSEKEFYGAHGVNLNALVCLLRYAAWKEPDKLKDWIMRPGCQWDQASINDTIVKRFSLYEPDGDDGAQLRIHIFDDAEDTSKHNHQRSFISMCIQGSYEYRYYKVEEKEEGVPIEYWKRINKTFQKDRDLTGTIKRVKHSYDDHEGTEINPDEEKFIFNTESGPLFVHDEWFHTVHPHNKEQAVITVLLRREKGKQKGDTIFIKGPGDKDFEVEEEPYLAPPDDVDNMFSLVRNALTNGAEVVESDFTINTNVIKEFMLDKSKIARVRPSLLKDEHCLNELKQFMLLNDFSFTPITEVRNSKEKLIKFIDVDGNNFFESQQDWLDPNTSILFGIMYTILSPNYVVPIVDKKTDEFLGILSLHDIMRNMSRLASPMIQSSLNSNQGSSVNDYNELINSLVELNKVVEKNNYRPHDSHTEGINNVLGCLNKLILDKRLVNLNIPDSSEVLQSGTFLEQISGEVFYVNPGAKYDALLREFYHTSGFSTFIEALDDNQFNIISILEVSDKKRKRMLKPLDSDKSPAELIEHIKKSEDNWPVYIKYPSKGKLGIISTDELFSRTGIQHISKQLDNISSTEKQEILARLLLKGHQKSPVFNEDDFRSIRRLFSENQ